MDRLVEMHRPIVEYLASHARGTPPYSFLDYGFGSGTFLRQVAASGHRAFGADISPQNVAQLAERSLRDGLSMGIVDLSSGNLDDLGQSHFDIVTLFQVIEHVPEPLALLRALSRHQQEGGVIYIECPNDASVLSRVKTFIQRLSPNGTKWRSMKYPEHLHGFNKKALGALLAAAGYEVVACGDYSHSDGMHQVEGVYWWPPFRENPAWYRPYGFSRSLIQLADSTMSRAFGSGSGLYAVGALVRNR